jgi:hypothetical protein
MRVPKNEPRRGFELIGPRFNWTFLNSDEPVVVRYAQTLEDIGMAVFVRNMLTGEIVYDARGTNG